MQPPQFLANVYGDLRNRRLLLPAGALLAALVAVPVLLSSSPPPPPDASPATAVEPTAATPAVLAEQVGIRNYRKRLEALKEKNPFDQKFAAPAPGSVDITELDSGSLAPSDGEPQSTAAGSPPVDSGPSAAPTPSRSQGSTGRSEPSEPPKPRVKRVWWTWHIDLAFGLAGDVERHDGVRPLDLLPTRRNPIVAFLGAGPVGKRATFLISDQVTSSEGDGSCAPTNRLCYFLKLSPGEGRRLTVAPEEDGPEVTYRLKLRKINAKVIKGPRE